MTEYSREQIEGAIRNLKARLGDDMILMEEDIELFEKELGL